MRLHGVREISKKFEEIREGRTAEYIEYFTAHSPRGEFVIGLRKFLKIVLNLCPRLGTRSLFLFFFSVQTELFLKDIHQKRRLPLQHHKYHLHRRRDRSLLDHR